MEQTIQFCTAPDGARIAYAVSGHKILGMLAVVASVVSFAVWLLA